MKEGSDPSSLPLSGRAPTAPQKLITLLRSGGNEFKRLLQWSRSMLNRSDIPNWMTLIIALGTLALGRYTSRDQRADEIEKLLAERHEKVDEAINAYTISNEASVNKLTRELGLYTRKMDASGSLLGVNRKLFAKDVILKELVHRTAEQCVAKNQVVETRRKCFALEHDISFEKVSKSKEVEVKLPKDEQELKISQMRFVAAERETLKELNDAVRPFYEAMNTPFVPLTVEDLRKLDIYGDVW
jgi:hypothetical protein